VGLYVVGPRSTATVRLNAAGLRSGDIAGVALFSAVALAPDRHDSGLSDARTAFSAHFAGRTTRRCAWLGVEQGSDGFTLIEFAGHSGRTSRVPLSDGPVWLRAECDFLRNRVGFRYGSDGTTYVDIGEPHPIGDEPNAAQAIWCSLFCRSTDGHAEGGHADFDSLLLTTEGVEAPGQEALRPRRRRRRTTRWRPGARLRPGQSSPARRVRDR
jgi:hypothetical protein